MPDAIAPASNYFATQATAAQSAATAAKDRTKTDSDTFLTLLVAQMRYQNPLEPMKGTEFIAQSAQLATVEALQAIQSAQTSAQTWTRMSSAQQMLGTRVEAVDGDGNPVTGIAAGVTATTAGPQLTLLTSTGKVQVSLDSVRSSVYLAAGAPAGGSTGATGGPTTGGTTGAGTTSSPAPAAPPADDEDTAPSGS